MEAQVFGEEQWKLIQNEYPALKEQVYLDHAGAALYPSSEIQAVSADLQANIYGNPHSPHPSSRLTSDLVENVRLSILQHFNTSQQHYEVVFTSGATQACKLVAEHFPFTPESTFAYLQESHTSVMGMRGYAHRKNAQIYVLPTSKALPAFKAEILPSPDSQTSNNYSLFAFPPQCNFSGTQYPLEWVSLTQKGLLDQILTSHGINLTKVPSSTSQKASKWLVYLDAASYVATKSLDLSLERPEFVGVSFYKIFGYPTGLGALLVRKDVVPILQTEHRSYFGGGTVLMAMTQKLKHELRPRLHESWEDGTLNFLAILALRHSFAALRRLAISMDHVTRHTHNMAHYARHKLDLITHANGGRFVELYGLSEACGGIVAFNLKNRLGAYIGFAQVERILGLYNIHVRTGCFCNPGACQTYLNLKNEDVERHFHAGHVCGDQHDLIDGHPTGAVRISFGYYSLRSHVDRLLAVLEDCFLNSPRVFERPLADMEDLLSVSPRLRAIHLYPVKSGGPLSVQKWPVGPKGLRYDRHFSVINSLGKGLDLKKEPKLCLLEPQVDLERGTLTLSFPGFGSVDADLEDKENENPVTAATCVTKVCGEKILGQDCGEEAALWLQDVFNQEGLRLIRQHKSDERVSKAKAPLSMANDSHFLVVNHISLLKLKQDMEEMDHTLTYDPKELLDRFRGNLIIEGVEPYQEEKWDTFQIGKLALKSEGDCPRCQMICVDTNTGDPSNEPLRALGAIRGPKVPFGVLTAIGKHNQAEIELCVGDVVTWE